MKIFAADWFRGIILKLIPVIISFSSISIADQDRPNILWLTVEDISPELFGCYGNPYVSTPNIDHLAEKGVRYTNAYSNAPYCSPARATIISGAYATTYGTDIHRSPVVVPEEQYFFPRHLRESGYFCTNRVKRDYNTTKATDAWIDQNVWNYNDRRATYNNPERGPVQPFFAVFNNTVTHMTRVITLGTEGRPSHRIDPESVTLPPHVPDLPEIRSDYAVHLEGAEDVDKWVGLFLKDLKEAGVADDTIIFFFSDHGGCLPRGKGYPYESGLRVPFIVYAPPKWQHLLRDKPGSVSDRPIAFVDLAPTVLSLAGLDAQAYHQGIAFLGDNAGEARAYNFGFRTNRGTHYDPARTISDGRFKYIRNFTPGKPDSLRQFYQWQMPAQLAWDRHHLSDDLPESFNYLFKPKPAEMLFDLESDPWERNNLAENPDYAEKLQELRNELLIHLHQTDDLGFFPKSIKHQLNRKGIWEWVQVSGYPLDELIDTAWIASKGNSENLNRFVDLIQNERPEMRFWGVTGINLLLKQGAIKALPSGFEKLTNDSCPEVAVAAAEGIIYVQPQKGLEILVELFKDPVTSAAAASTLEGLDIKDPRFLEELTELHEAETERLVRQRELRSLLINANALPLDDYFSEEEWQAGEERAANVADWRNPSFRYNPESSTVN